MNFMRNQFVVGGLVVVALAVVGYQFLHLRRPRAQAPGSPLAAPAVPAPAPAVASAPVPAKTPLSSTPAPPELRMDTNFLQSNFGSSTGLPQRDPFLTQTPGRADGTGTVAILKFNLKAIWRQTGSLLAAIDKGIYREGDTIVEGYKVEKIEDDRVWLDEPDGKKELGFPGHEPLGTNAPPAK